MAAGLPAVGWRAGNLPHVADTGARPSSYPGDRSGLAAALERLARPAPEGSDGRRGRRPARRLPRRQDRLITRRRGVDDERVARTCGGGRARRLAAFAPQAPCTPPPGWADDEARYRRRIGPRVGRGPGRGGTRAAGEIGSSPHSCPRRLGRRPGSAVQPATGRGRRGRGPGSRAHAPSPSARSCGPRRGRLLPTGDDARRPRRRARARACRPTRTRSRGVIAWDRPWSSARGRRTGAQVAARC